MEKTPAGLASPTLPHPGPLGLRDVRYPRPIHAKSQHRGSADEELCFSLPPVFQPPHITGCSFCLCSLSSPPQEEGGSPRLRQSGPAPGCPPRSVNVSVNVQLPFSIKRLKRVCVHHCGERAPRSNRSAAWCRGVELHGLAAVRSQTPAGARGPAKARPPPGVAWNSLEQRQSPTPLTLCSSADHRHR